MAVSDLVVGLGSALGGFNQGRQQYYQNQLQQAQMKNEQAKTAESMAGQGLKYDDQGNVITDPGFLDPNNPSNQRAMMVAKMKAASSPKFMQDPPSLRTAWQLANPGQAVPDHLQGDLGDQPYHQDLNSLLTRKPTDPGIKPLDPARAMQLEKLMGWPAGAASGMTENNFEKLTSNVTGQKYAADKTASVIENENARNDANIGARKDIVDTEAANRQQMPLNQAYAKDYNDYTSGGRASSVEAVNRMRQSAQKLATHQAPGGDFLSSVNSAVTSAIPGVAPITDPELAQIKTDADSASATGLKALLGGRGMTNQDVKLGLGFNYNPRLSPQKNSELLNRAADAMQAKMKEQDKKALFYEGNNHNLKGYQAPLGQEDDSSDPDLQDDGKPVVNPSDVRAKAAKTGGAAVNGGVISSKTLANIRSMPTKGTASMPQDGAFKTVGSDTYKRQGGKWVQVMAGEPTE